MCLTESIPLIDWTNLSQIKKSAKNVSYNMLSYKTNYVYARHSWISKNSCLITLLTEDWIMEHFCSIIRYFNGTHLVYLSTWKRF